MTKRVIQNLLAPVQVKQSRKKPLQVKTPRALPTMEAHQVIRANALFLLSLSSAAEPSMLCHHPPRPLHSQLLPSLKEGVSDELPNKMGCLYLQTLARYLSARSSTHVSVVLLSLTVLSVSQATHGELRRLPGRQPLPGRDEVPALHLRSRAVHFSHA